MSLHEAAYLEIQGEGDTIATFEFSVGLQIDSALEKRYLMGERGQYIREVVNQTPGTGSVDADRRTGFWIDGGGGDWQLTLDFSAGLKTNQWGDGESSGGPSNVTTTDASGQGVKPLSRIEVLQHWLARSKSDSGGDTRLHKGEWTDGNISNVSGVSAGAYAEPMYVAIRDSNLSMPDPRNEGPTAFDGTITMSRVALWGAYGAPDWAEDAIGAAIETADIIPD